MSPLMTLWIIRHGKAERDSPTGLDADRALKRRGERQAAHLGAEFAGRADAPARLITSPFVRAQQTADGIAGVTLQEVEIHHALESGRGAASVLALVGELAGAEGETPSCALVGHNPELSQAVAALAGAESVGELRTGQAVALERDGAAWAVTDVVRLDD